MQVTTRRPALTYPTLRQPGAVVAGRGAVRHILDEPGLDRALVFISGQESVSRRVADSLARRSGALPADRTITKPAGEPTLEMVRYGAAFVQRHRPDWIIAIGGGAVLDWARLAWAEAAGLIANPGTTPSLAAPGFCLVPTTCASGAEAASVAVMVVDGRKTPVVLPDFIARTVVLDSQFIDDLAAPLLERSLADVLSHGIESFTSLVPNGLAKEAAISSLTLVTEHYRPGASGCAADKLSQAAYLGGLAASQCSVGVVHAWAHAIARHGFSHGLANALGLRAGLALNGGTDAVRELLRRLHMSSVADLTAAIGPVIEGAVTAGDRQAVSVLLADAETRAQIAGSMLGDVCLRTNPRRLDAAGVDEFLASVELECGA